MKKSKHGMTSEMARDKKISGHKNENIVAEQLNGTVIKGRGKVDIITSNGVKVSCKQGKKTHALSVPPLGMREGLEVGAEGLAELEDGTRVG